MARRFVLVALGTVFLFACFLMLEAAFPRHARGAVTSDYARQRFVGTSINLAATGTTVIVPAQPRKFIVKNCTIHIRTSTGLIIAPSASIGTNATSYNNIMAITIIGSSGTVADNLVDLSTSLLTTAMDLTSTGVTLKVTTGATATALVADVHIEGFFSEP